MIKEHNGLLIGDIQTLVYLRTLLDMDLVYSNLNGEDLIPCMIIINAPFAKGHRHIADLYTHTRSLHGLTLLLDILVPSSIGV